MRPGLGEHFILSPCRAKEIQHRLEPIRERLLHVLGNLGGLRAILGEDTLGVTCTMREFLDHRVGL